MQMVALKGGHLMMTVALSSAVLGQVEGRMGKECSSLCLQVRTMKCMGGMMSVTPASAVLGQA